MIFLDTSFLAALFNSRDADHLRAKELMKKIEKGEYGSFATSDYVFDELMTFLQARTKNHDLAVQSGIFLRSSETTTYYVLPTIFDETWKLFQKRSGLSFTDCSTIELMKANTIKNVASFDQDFASFKEVNVIR